MFVNVSSAELRRVSWRGSNGLDNAGGEAISERSVTQRAAVSVQRAVAFAALCGVLVACSAGSGVFRPPQLFSTIIMKQPPRASEERMALADLQTISTAGTAVAADAARGQSLEIDPGGYDRVGVASWYGGQFHGRYTANGEIFDRTVLTAAHPSLPLPSYVRVTNLENDRSIILRVNDRGPYYGNRLIDVSEQAAEILAFRRDGSTKVRVQYISPAPKGTDDMAMLLGTYRGPSLPVTDTLAFARDEEAPALGSGAVTAMRKLAQVESANERIFMAFIIAEQGEH